MKDILVMNNETGEIVPATKAIKEFYSDKRHGYMDAWTDYYTETDLEADAEIENPLNAFIGSVAV